MPDPVRIRTLTDGGQDAEGVAAQLAAFLGAARSRLDLALYDVRLPGAAGDVVADAVRAAAARGVAVRIAFNADEDDRGAASAGGRPRRVLPPPPRTDPEILHTLGVPLRGIPEEPDLMHHKYAVRDGDAVWTGSTNWTADAWTRQENVLIEVRSAGIAAAYARNFEELWSSGRVQGSGAWDVPPVEIGAASARAWFCPGRGEQLSHRIAKAIGAARRRVRIASPVLTSGPILGTLGEVVAERRVDLAGICDGPQVAQVFRQWRENAASSWKAPLLERVLRDGSFTAKASTPWAPGRVHDVMHAKVTVADDTVFCGSFNLSRSGEDNAENVLELRDPAAADALAAYVDALRARYPEPLTDPGRA